MTRREVEIFIKAVSRASWNRQARGEYVPDLTDFEKASKEHEDPEWRKFLSAIVQHDIHPLTFKDLTEDEIDLLYATYSGATMN